MDTIGLPPGITLRSLASSGEWLALFAKETLDDYITVRIIAWAHAVVEGREEAAKEAFGAIVPGHDVDGCDLVFAPAHPRFMGYLGPGQLLSDQFVRERLEALRQRGG